MQTVERWGGGDVLGGCSKPMSPRISATSNLRRRGDIVWLAGAVQQIPNKYWIIIFGDISAGGVHANANEPDR
eukprot:COSAG01_NODE_61143_length_291_cov_0.531250_1_plen_72_part_10